MFREMDRFFACHHREELAREVAAERLGRRPRNRRWHLWSSRPVAKLDAGPVDGRLRPGEI